MGLFSDRRWLPRPIGWRLSIRLHSEYSLTERMVRGARGIGRVLVAASNDARVVGVFLVLAAAALAVEMAASFK
jgi:hypothetical protein